ncbi:response regulator [Mucilaginibacter angelicae]|uniref:Response regulator n=1 Tax=Mucilaginibacter angelicae TaxID=869718 RepID=A0ABV6L2Y6_9SPHI
METILLQESDAAVFDIVSTALEMEGYRVFSLSNQHENALEMVRRHQPGLVLLDYWLRNHSGKLCHWIKSHFPGVHIVVFSSDPGIRQQYHTLGFDGYLNKPFDLEELYAIVKKYARAPRARGRKQMPVNG